MVTADNSSETGNKSAVSNATATSSRPSTLSSSMCDTSLCSLFLPLQSSDEKETTGDNVPKLTQVDDGSNSEDSNSDNIGMSPFVVYENSGRETPYPWPNLYTEMSEMLEASALVYALAELRGKVRDKVIDDATALQKIMKIPITLIDIATFVEERPCDVEDIRFAKHFYVNILQKAVERDRQQQLEGKPRAIVALDDEYANEELVYSVDVDHVRERVTVSFRGTVTKHDWTENKEIYMKDVPNPIYRRQMSEQEEYIRVHSGFYDYMFKPSWRGVKGPKGEALSEYQEIMQEYVWPVLKQYPHYKLYTTGHSLGGALATLFAFQLATLPDSVVPKPVSVFTFGGPYVGDESFRLAHRWLERQGKLRHMRVVNHKDLIPLVPKFSFKWNIFDRVAHVGTLFKHVGMNARLFEHGNKEEPQISFPKVRTGYFSSFWDEIDRGWDQTLFSNFSWSPKAYIEFPFHALSEYGRRLEASKAKLETMSLNDLYARKDLVGNLVAEF